MANYTFRAQKMLDRVKREGREELLTEKTVEFIKSLDGQTGTDYNWKSQVMGEPLVWLEEARTYVNIEDCD